MCIYLNGHFSLRYAFFSSVNGYTYLMDRNLRGKLMHIFDRTTECYKLFWFKAILEKVEEGRSSISFEEIVDDMISSAWYMVSEYHLSLGPNDGLEKLIETLQPSSNLKPSEEKKKLLAYLKSSDDSALKKEKMRLIRFVPYCILSPFFPSLTRLDKYSGRTAVSIINDNDDTIYRFSEYKGLETLITIRDDWIEYMRENCTLLKSWVDYNLINYLQKRNPSVPGIPNKLSAPEKRNLLDVSRYWKEIIKIEPLREIYFSTPLTPGDISIDHFVPFSYVSSDEFWNLSPTTKSINSSKGNNLPSWERYFCPLVDIHYQSYSLIQRYPQIRELFEKTSKDHFSSLNVKERLYNKKDLTKSDFKAILSEIMEVEYKAALNCGFKLWG